MPTDPFADRRLYGRSFADIYDEWYADVSDAHATAVRIADLVSRDIARRPVIELGVGTGRIAAALAAQRLAVVGLDASREMLHALRRKPLLSDVAVVEADMAAIPFRSGSVGIILAAFNTLFNLADLDAIASCIRDSARALCTGGWLAIEAFVPPGPDEADDSGVSVRTIAVDQVVLSAAQRDRARQTIVGQHIEITERDGVRLRPWRLCYATPDQLDAMAAAAGLALDSRHGGWDGEPFDGGSLNHVTLYRKAPAAASRAASA